MPAPFLVALVWLLSACVCPTSPLTVFSAFWTLSVAMLKLSSSQNQHRKDRRSQRCFSPAVTRLPDILIRTIAAMGLAAVFTAYCRSVLPFSRRVAPRFRA